MQRCTRRLASAAIKASRTGLKRFVPPWEREGRTAEEFFAGVMTSANPIQEMRKDAARLDNMQDAALLADPLTPEDYRRMEERDAHNAAVEEAQRNFLPYGAIPKEYFDESQMAAWGEYTSRLQHMPEPGAIDPETGLSRNRPDETGYPADTKRLLLDDMHSKIPYRYDRYVPLQANATPKWPLHGTAGVVMDIDGVVYRSKKLIAGSDSAIETLKELRIPFLFMTNGGGKSEAEKATELTELLGTYVDPSQVLVSHSPMRLLAPLYRQRNVLIVGPPHCAEIARDYGFEKAVSILQFQANHPEMLPYKKWEREPLVRPKPAHARVSAFPQIDAIFQFHDPEDPFNDIQTIIDVLSAHRGRVGHAVSGVQSVPYFVSADDLLWATEAPLPRLGQGAFREMLSSVYECVTGQGLQVVMYGKPRAIAYEYAAQRLRTIAAHLGWQPEAMRAVFMIGDNIETDIMGANAAQAPWTSVHVLSGIGAVPAARRTLAVGDAEHEWLEDCVSRTPHYIAPTLDHFVRELLAFPEEAVLQNRKPYFGKPNPVNLKEVYNFTR